MTMRTPDLLLTVRHTFATNRLRVALTLLGVMIGAGAMVLLAGLITASEEALLRTAQNANESDMISVRRRDPPPQDRDRTTKPLSAYDGAALQDSALLRGARVSTAAQRQTTARARGNTKRTTVFGAEADALPLYRLELESGRYFVPSDFEQRRRVCVVGQEMWTELLEKAPVGRTNADVTLSVDGVVFHVVGVLAHKPTMGRGSGTWMWDRRTLVPSTTFAAVFEPTRAVRGLYVRLKDVADLSTKVAQLTDVVERTLLRRHNNVKNFRIEDDARGKDQEELILRIIEVLLFGTGVIALLVGGINIMNIMLVTVAERTREIGLRRALGATPNSIAAQFLLEAAVLGAIGGVLGVVGGVALTFVLAQVLTAVLGQWRFVVELWSVALALGMAVGVGLVFGFMPARRAARLLPTEALRTEM